MLCCLDVQNPVVADDQQITDSESEPMDSEPVIADTSPIVCTSKAHSPPTITNLSLVIPTDFNFNGSLCQTNIANADVASLRRQAFFEHAVEVIVDDTSQDHSLAANNKLPMTSGGSTLPLKASDVDLSCSQQRLGIADADVVSCQPALFNAAVEEVYTDAICNNQETLAVEDMLGTQDDDAAVTTVPSADEVQSDNVSTNNIHILHNDVTDEVEAVERHTVSANDVYSHDGCEIVEASVETVEIPCDDAVLKPDMHVDDQHECPVEQLEVDNVAADVIGDVVETSQRACDAPATEGVSVVQVPTVTIVSDVGVSPFPSSDITESANCHIATSMECGRAEFAEEEMADVAETESVAMTAAESQTQLDTDTCVGDVVPVQHDTHVASASVALTGTTTQHSQVSPPGIFGFNLLSNF